MHQFLKALRDYARFAGKARRRGFWISTLINTVTTSLLRVGEQAGEVRLPAPAIGAFYIGVMLIPAMALGARRLHHARRPG
ncbi:DUF805 domain-containing protein [Streptomyces bathyalis]|uniref:DUF805 domain-containing protein n=1 Tax=Streptomyces bathyalis TaxID=2710756 RepID=A0A7T1WR66_9ACTN|nr:DUF805 domain-containing protein [Streptomyces bathyalis]QPP06131.1 DUF805 domain-containing protein [Streptomyces bathyalis]